MRNLSVKIVIIIEKKIVLPLTKTSFNIFSKNICIILNVRENAKKITLRISKSLKKKGKYIDVTNKKNVEEDHSTQLLSK